MTTRMGDGDSGNPFDALDEQLLLDLAGPASFERGVGYHRGGNVSKLDVVAAGTLQATVSGTRSYVARLTIDMHARRRRRAARILGDRLRIEPDRARQAHTRGHDGFGRSG